MAMSEARRRANKKWDHKNYKRINMALNVRDYDRIVKYCQIREISKNSFMKQSCLEKIDRDIEYRREHENFNVSKSGYGSNNNIDKDKE